VPVGLLACALLVANNLRDVPTDTESGKRTLAVLLGGPRTRILYAACTALPFPIALAMAAPHPWVLMAMLATPLSLPPMQKVMQGAKGSELIPVLGETGRLQIAYGALLAVGLAL
jgi:1,4-dihydroxy-2-naphthoate polyprenyltransferase